MKGKGDTVHDVKTQSLHPSPCTLYLSPFTLNPTCKMLNKFIKYFLNNRLITALLLIVIVLWGISVAPFNWHKGWLPSDPIPVDAIPDIG